MPVTEHDYHIKVENDIAIWRYMSKGKFESLLKERALFFCRAEKFSDIYECSLPKKEVDYRTSVEHHEAIERAFGENRPFDAEKAKKNSENLADMHQKVKRATTVNCWHINDNESDAMWQLYLKNNEGVAVKSTPARLQASLAGTKEELGLSRVRYIDYDIGAWYHPDEYPHPHYNTLIPLIHKRIEFQHEKELRLYHWKAEREKPDYWAKLGDKTGELIPVDIGKLVKSVIFHPTANQIVKNNIIGLSRAYGYDFQFRESRMGGQPLY